jgi:hypothetical protein
MGPFEAFDCGTSPLRDAARQPRLREEGNLHDQYEITTTTRLFFHVLLPGLVTLQAALCATQSSFWHALLHYSTL